MSSFVEIGDMNERLEFFQKNNGKDALGGNISTEKKVHTCWASVRSQYLNDIRANLGTVLEGTITFIIRYDQSYALTNDLEVKWNGQFYDIVSLNPDTVKKDFTTIVAKAVS